jgi:hypothetical protein
LKLFATFYFVSLILLNYQVDENLNLKNLNCKKEIVVKNIADNKSENCEKIDPLEDVILNKSCCRYRLNIYNKIDNISLVKIEFSSILYKPPEISL